MKYLFLLGVLLGGGCTSQSDENLNSQAIATLLRKNLGTAATYQSVRWGKPQPWTRGDSAVLLLFNLRPQLQTFNFYIALDSTKLADPTKSSNQKESVQTVTSSLVLCRQLRDSVRQLIRALPAPTDTTHLGYYIKHTFRFKNAAGLYVLDSMDFYVDKRGKVKMAG